MKARHTLFAAGSTVTLVAGGIFLSAAPASANHNSPECLTATSEFTAALHTVELNAELKVQLTDALQGLVDAQVALDLLDVEGTLTLEELDLLVADALLKVKTEQLPNINALINANAGAGGAVGEARALLEVVTNGDFDQATAEALLELGINVDDFLSAALDETAIIAAIEAALSPAEAAVLISVVERGELNEEVVAALLRIGIDVTADAFLLDPEVDEEELEAALELRIEALIVEAEAEIEALLASGDLEAILAAEAELEALLGVDLNLSALADLELQVAVALAILDAQADLDAAITVLNGLQVKLDALNINHLLEVEALFEAAIEACAGAGVVVGGDNNNDGHDRDNGAGGTGGVVTTGGSNGGTGGVNRGMNVQTAVATASTDPAGIGALAAGIGVMVAAGTVAARRVRHS